MVHVIPVSILQVLMVLAYCFTKSIQLETTPKEVQKCVEVDGYGSLEWDRESEHHCPDNPSWFHCLQEETGKNKFYQFCRKYIIVDAGTYPTYSPISDQIHPRDCPEGTYQNGRKKSSEINKCNEKVKCDAYGQLICQEGSKTENRLCKCDYKSGKVITSYFDNPSTARECCPDSNPSCGCFPQKCKNEDEELNEIYQCVPKCQDEKCRATSEVTPTDLTSPKSTTVKTTTLRTKNRSSIPKSPVSDGNNTDVKTTSLIVIGIIVAVLLIIIIVGLVLYCCFRERYDSFYDWCCCVKRIPIRGCCGLCKNVKSRRKRNTPDSVPLRKIEDTTFSYNEIENVVNSQLKQRVGRIECGNKTGTAFRVGDVFVASAYHLFKEAIDRMLWNVLFQVVQNSEAKKLKEVLAEKLKVSYENTTIADSEYEIVKHGISEWKSTFSHGATFKDLINTGVFEGLEKSTTDLDNLVMKEWNARVTFSYTNEHIDTKMIFRLDHNIEFYDKNKDVIILKLVEEKGKNIPCPFLLEAGPTVSKMHLLGHPDGNFLQFDAKCEVYTESDEEQLQNDTKDAFKYCKYYHKQWCQTKNCKGDDLKDLKNEYESIIPEYKGGCVIFHCSESTVHGASGSPGIILQTNMNPDDVNAFKVQAMLQKGLPATLYKNLNREKRKNLRQKVMFEEGILMRTLHELLSDVPELRRNLFHLPSDAGTKNSPVDSKVGNISKSKGWNNDQESRNLFSKTDEVKGESTQPTTHSVIHHYYHTAYNIDNVANLAAGEHPTMKVKTYPLIHQEKEGTTSPANNSESDLEEKEAEEFLKSSKKSKKTEKHNDGKKSRNKDGREYLQLPQNDVYGEFGNAINNKDNKEEVWNSLHSDKETTNNNQNSRNSFDILKENIKQLKLKIRTPMTKADGNCFFHAIIDQLKRVNLRFSDHTTLRKEIVSFLRNIPQTQIENLSLKEFVEGESCNKEQRWEDYLTRMSCDGTYADEIIVKYMAEMLNQTIVVVTSSPGGSEADQLQKLYNQESPSNDKPLLIGHIYENHYVSLEPDNMST